MLKITNQCYPTLKELLQQNEDSLGTLKELAKLHKLLDLDKESIKYNEKIIKKEKDTTVRELAQSYIKIEDFRNAIQCICFVTVAKNARKKYFR